MQSAANRGHLKSFLNGKGVESPRSLEPEARLIMLRHGHSRLAIAAAALLASGGLEWPRRVISVGESVLANFPSDQWTQSVHLIVGEAFASAWQFGNDGSGGPGPEKGQLLRKAEAHDRAWYASSTSEGDRALVWEEIWALDAGMPPRLMFGHCPMDAWM